MPRSKLQNMTRCALAAAVMAVCAWITIPGPVPFTLQTMGLYLTLMLLGGRLGTLAVAGYLALGAMGLPVFSGFQGGFGVLLGPTGGYLAGFLVCAGIYWLLSVRGIHPAAALVAGTAGCYCFGTAWYFLLYDGGKTIWAIAGMCVAPFVIPDGLKLVLAWRIGKRLRPVLK